VKDGPKLLAFAGYKAGTTYVRKVEDNPNSPSYGKEVVSPATIIETPPAVVFAIRVYGKSERGLKTLTEVWAEEVPKDLGRALSIPKEADLKGRLTAVDKRVDEVEEVRLLLCTQPREAGIGKKSPDILEVKVGGGDVRQQLDYAKSLLGKQVRISDVLKVGQYVDVIGVTKGKGFAGPVKRWGVALLPHKSRKRRREVGTLGPWHPARVMPTIPRAGQMGFHQRTEYRKLILKMGSGGEVVPRGGFLHYGIVRSDYVMLEGSVPGPPKRLIKIRHSMRAGEEEVREPKITFVNLESQQGL
jgi:large subunit ribosomal protein L3